MKKITLYSLSTCPTCRKMKHFLEEHAVVYQLIEVDTLDSGEQWYMSRELAKRNPQCTFPTLIIEDIVVGFDAEELSSKLLEGAQ